MILDLSGYYEDALENVLEQRMTRFLLELGEGWVSQNMTM